MSFLADLFNALYESGVLAATLVIGALCIVMAIIGRIHTYIVLDRGRAILLGGFGALLIVLSLIGFFVSLPDATSIPVTNTTVSPSPINGDSTIAVTAVTTTSPMFCRQTVTENGIPSGGTYTLTVNPNEFHLWSSADICVSYNNTRTNCVVGDVDKGFITVFRPVNNESTTYELSSLVPINNWHGVYENCSSEEQEGWTQNRASALSQPPNCADGDGCGDVQILTFQGSSFDRRQYSP